MHALRSFREHGKKIQEHPKNLTKQTQNQHAAGNCHEISQSKQNQNY